MKISDFKIHSTDKLDNILAECCAQVIAHQKQNSDRYGLVGSAVLDTDNRVVYGVNTLVDDSGLRDHAEVVAVKNYQDKYGDIPSGSIIITTLSPCSTDIDQPDGINCTEYINNLGVHKVYCGYRDPTQVDTEIYKSKQFHLRETRNKKLRELCKSFADTFLDRAETVNEFKEIPKRNWGDDPDYYRKYIWEPFRNEIVARLVASGWRMLYPRNPGENSTIIDANKHYQQSNRAIRILIEPRKRNNDEYGGTLRAMYFSVMPKVNQPTDIVDLGEDDAYVDLKPNNVDSVMNKINQFNKDLFRL